MNNSNIRLKEEREKKNLSAEAFGAVGGVRKTAQYAYEKGERKPDGEYFANIAKIGCDVQYIITGEPSSAKLTNDEIFLLELFRQANLQLKAAAVRVLGGNVEFEKSNMGDNNAVGNNNITGGIHIGSHISGSDNTVNVDMNKKKE